MNLSKPEWKDLYALKKNSKIIIEEPDKGGCVVSINNPYYKNMIHQYLNDSKFENHVIK